MKISIVIASANRRDELSYWVDFAAMRRQNFYEMIFAVVRPEDLPIAASQTAGIRVVFSEIGLTKQRNAALRALSPDTDLVAFFDDDYMPADQCLSGIARFFSTNPNVAGANGLLIADGIHGPGISIEEAHSMIKNFKGEFRSQNSIVRELEGLYGCNMIFRTSAIAGIFFDEDLPLYGWQEDIDFAARVRSMGRIVKTNAFFGVHRGVKKGRTSGVRFGYSQVANPIYLFRKGSMSLIYALKLISSNFIANHIKILRPEDWVDRVGRTRGNWIAIFDLFTGKLSPQRVNDI